MSTKMSKCHEWRILGRERGTDKNLDVWKDLEVSNEPGPLGLNKAERKDAEELSHLASPWGLAVQMMKKMFRKW